jgi:hypothetical protein
VITTTASAVTLLAIWAALYMKALLTEQPAFPDWSWNYSETIHHPSANVLQNQLRPGNINFGGYR